MNVGERVANNDDKWDFEVKVVAGSETLTIRRYWFNNQEYYFTNTQRTFEIHPSLVDVDTFYNEIDDFEKVLLNRYSNPKYTATLDFPHETERGVETYKKQFTWPLDGTWNLDIKSEAYTIYVKELLKLAAFYDEYQTDNLWRMMTHESIKNMDTTFSNPALDEDKDDYNIGTTKMQGLLWAYGRQFDELKRYIDVIKSVNTINYNGNGNIPDYFLTDTLNLSGWEISSAVYWLLKSEKSKPGLFPGLLPTKQSK